MRAVHRLSVVLGLALPLGLSCAASVGSGLRRGSFVEAMREARTISASTLRDERLIDRPLIVVFGNAALSPPERTEVLRVLLARGAPADAIDRDGDTALLCAARSGEVEAAALLLDHGASVDMVNREGESAFSLALTRGDLPLARLLTERGANLDTRNASDETPLFLAALTGDTAEVERLLVLGAPLEVRGQTALMGGCAGGHFELVRHLVEVRQANVGTTNGFGENALSYAAECGDLAVFDYLIARGVDYRSGRRTPLMAAASSGHVNLVDRLLRMGVAPDEAADGNEPAIAHAAVRLHQEVVCRLLAAGARVPELQVEDAALRGAGFQTLAACLRDAGRVGEAVVCLERSATDYLAAADELDRAAQAFDDEARSAALSRLFLALAAGALPSLQREQAEIEARQLAQVSALQHAAEQRTGLAGYYAAYDPERAMNVVTRGSMTYGAPLGSASTWARSRAPERASYHDLAAEARRLRDELRERAKSQRALAETLAAKRG